MVDRTVSVTCPSQKSESSLISPHHVHHTHVIKSGGVGKDTAVCSKSCPEENNEQYNGCLQTDCSVSKHTDQSQNALKCTDLDSDCVHGSNCNSQGKQVERVNGFVEHSSGDNKFHKIENWNYNVDSNYESDPKCHLKQSDNDVSFDGIEIGKPNEVFPENHHSVEHTDDVDKLGNELDKTSLHHHSNSCDFLLASSDVINGVTYIVYESEKQMPAIMSLIVKDLSEPYSIYTYRYFIHNWPKLCFLAIADNKYVGAIVCKLDPHKSKLDPHKPVQRGYIAMLAVDSKYRGRQIGSTLVTKAIEAMITDGCNEVVLETEITNQVALHLYENLGFVRDKRLFRYYLNGVDALRLKLWLPREKQDNFVCC